LEGDIRACFDECSHAWLVAHIPMERAILQKWLKAGFVDKHVLSPTEAGVPQGGICSPVIAHLALDGLERVVKAYASLPTQRAQRAKVNLVRFAEDFIITGSSSELLEQEIKPLVEQFLRERGLELSPEKTRMTHIEDGFDFLGQHVRKYAGKLLIKPAQKNVKAFLGKIRKIVKANKQATTANLIAQLNPVIRGWANYHRHVCSGKTFWTADRIVHDQVLRWARRTHPNKSYGWLKRKYYSAAGTWAFATRTRTSTGESKVLRLYQIAKTVIARHIKVRGEANPYDPKYTEYFERRRSLAGRVLCPGRKTGQASPAAV